MEKETKFKKFRKKWGMGWIFLMIFLLYAIPRTQYYKSDSEILTIPFGIIIGLLSYFALRKGILLSKIKRAEIRSFVAGFLAYLFVYILITILNSYL